ncbi:MAG: ribulose-phosphate 3-epimerase [Planctomycetaceae bacterium]
MERLARVIVLLHSPGDDSSQVKSYVSMCQSAILASLRPCLPLIAPSMLKCDFGNLHREVELLDSASADVLHWDVMDGHFVPNLSYGAMVIERVRPRSEAIFDVHLMISNPAQYVAEYVAAGADWITFHIETDTNHAALLDEIRASGCGAGLAINPKTDVARIAPLLKHCDLVLIMSVEPGFGGQKFQPDVLSKVHWLREQVGDKLLISIDGGIGTSTISQAAAAGVDLFVAGSAVFDAPDYVVAMEQLRLLAVQGRTTAEVV